VNDKLIPKKDNGVNEKKKKTVMNDLDDFFGEKKVESNPAVENEDEEYVYEEVEDDS